MRLLLSSILFILLTGCVTEKRCMEKFPPSIHDTIIYKDSIYLVKDTVYVPYQEVTFDDRIPCPDLVYGKTVSKAGLTSTVNINKGVLTVTCKADSLQAIIDVQNHYITESKNHSETKVITEIIPPWWAKWALGGFVISLLILIVLLALRAAKSSLLKIFNK